MCDNKRAAPDLILTFVCVCVEGPPHIKAPPRNGPASHKLIWDVGGKDTILPTPLYIYNRLYIKFPSCPSFHWQSHRPDHDVTPCLYKNKQNGGL